MSFLDLMDWRLLGLAGVLMRFIGILEVGNGIALCVFILWTHKSHIGYPKATSAYVYFSKKLRVGGTAVDTITKVAIVMGLIEFESQSGNFA